MEKLYTNLEFWSGQGIIILNQIKYLILTIQIGFMVKLAVIRSKFSF